MTNEQNLKPIGSEAEAREKGRKGGIASGEARRQKKLLKECIEILLDKEIKDKSGNTMTGAEALAVRAFQDALKGNYKAWEIIRDTAGQKSVEKIQLSYERLKMEQ